LSVGLDHQSVDGVPIETDAKLDHGTVGTQAHQPRVRRAVDLVEEACDENLTVRLRTTAFTTANSRAGSAAR
jgi:hypothetical protein